MVTRRATLRPAFVPQSPLSHLPGRRGLRVAGAPARGPPAGAVLPPGLHAPPRLEPAHPTQSGGLLPSALRRGRGDPARVWPPVVARPTRLHPGPAYVGSDAPRSLPRPRHRHRRRPARRRHLGRHAGPLAVPGAGTLRHVSRQVSRGPAGTLSRRPTRISRLAPVARPTGRVRGPRRDGHQNSVGRLRQAALRRARHRARLSRPLHPPRAVPSFEFAQEARQLSTQLRRGDTLPPKE